uniref:RCC1-like domain-containing protein n=1 Tax=Vannella robusta TaxID=1487602 RepID=A0A7S4MBI4_9EUKA|mmetsp:Transcript_16890/g.21546  ORF Transcript_16890/g.21546 Transcript_16890/m.21546 type:complete len:383 (+) Transcript_16890:100-1248(+)
MQASVIRSPISCAYEHTIATDAQGNVWGWGKNDINQLGTNNEATLLCISPQKIGGVPPIHSVSCGHTHVAAIDLNKNVWTWGWNRYGQLGYGHTETSVQPQKINQLPAIFEVACGGNHTLALDENGRVWSWGFNSVDQLGVSSLTFSSVPVLIANLPRIVSISAGGNYSAAIDESNNLWVWGSHAQSWNLIDPKSCVPHILEIDAPIVYVSCGLNHAVAIDAENNLYSWGQNNYGQLGLCEFLWSFPSSDKPVLIPGLPPISLASCSESATTAIDTNGKPYVWGKMFVNRRNASSTTYFSSGIPVALDIPSTITLQYISCGSYHIIAIDKNDSVWSWGENDRGQLGLGHTQQQESPQQISIKLSPVKLSPLLQKSSRSMLPL